MGLMKDQFFTKKYWALALAILLFAFFLSSFYAFQRLTFPEKQLVRESVDWYEWKGGYEWSSTILKENPLWEGGSQVKGQAVYYTALSPQLNVQFYFQISSPSVKNVTIDYEIKIILSSSLSSSGKEITFWSKEETIDRGQVLNELRKEFELNITRIQEEIKEIEESINFRSGEKKVAVITSIDYQGEIDGKKVNDKKQFLLEIKLYSAYFEVSSQPASAKVKNEILREEIIPVPFWKKAIFVSLPAALLLSAIAIAVGKRKYKPLTEEEREYEKFKEQISIGKCLWDLKSLKAIKMESLKDLVETAIDTDKRVIFDPEKRIYFVLDNETLYFYAPSKEARK